LSGSRWLSDEVLAHLQEVAATPALELGARPHHERAATETSGLPEAAAGSLPSIGTRYELLGILGQGGMGTVYRALDGDLGREVAIKVVGPAAAARFDAPEQRLLAEARILARLEHPGLVPVHDLGTLPDGRVYYAMKQVRGERLDVYARQRGAAERNDLLRIFERVCETVAFAHAQGVIHRDLKPGNVMVGSFGEILVLDWGLAKVRRSASEPLPVDETPEPQAAPSGPPAESSTTAPGTLLGTPGYMAPELCRGGAADERSDVFALGAILRFLLTGSPELGGVGPVAPLALRAIVGKATAQEPQDRYVGAAELAADLARFLTGAAVEALPEGPLRRSLRFARRHATPILLLLAYLLVRLALILFAHR
jgi:eukaryotic-like serine/threonine-protein kinase